MPVSQDIRYVVKVTNPYFVQSDIASTRGAFLELQERAMYMERILNHAIKGIALDTKSLRQTALSIEETEKETQPETQPETDEAEMAVEEECTIDPVEDTVTHFSGEFSYWNFSMRVKRQIEDRMAASASLSQTPPNQISNYPRAKQLRSSSRTLAAAISCIPPRHIAEFLVSIFFKHAVTHYFYVDRPWLLARLTALYTNPEFLTSKDAPVLGIILTVFAIGTQYAYLEAKSAPASSSQSQNFSEDELGTMFYQEAIRLLPEIIEVSSLESVQACLLFAAYALPIDAAGLGYVYINLTIRLAMQNGMHRRCVGEAFSAAMMETRNRVWWTAYAMERKISIFHGRPLGMLRSDIDTHLPVDLGEQDSAGPYMLASIHLTHHLEDFYKEISLLRTTPKQDLPILLSRLADRKNDLEKWWSSLQPTIQKNDAQAPVDRSTAHIKLEHCLLRMFIGRPFLFSRGSPSNPTSPATPPSATAQKPTPRQELVTCCITAAADAISICSTLRDSDSGPGLARASYIEYSSCRAALLVLIAYSIQDRSDHFRKALRVGLDMIREMAASGESARSEVELIEALERALVRLRLFDEVGKVASDYEKFKQWESMWKRQNDGDCNSVETVAGSIQEQGWPTGEMDPSGMAESNVNLGSLRLFDGAAEWALFGGGSALPRELQHPETQMLGDFLSLHDPRFDPDLSQSL
ncbi:transcription factor domain-containing protein [Aspergillus fischeri NRRL 181]|uniref:Fungal specific transcription factor, putative n=1 Tax=Neosartorya fischeri (strain ATCC 1020 / DSM 3700 / CBS 544.65 / FGSC A1164 / JCM 1740 / NRRL 181 / WB 181) TaxID=331117 RepID=A1DBJ1_NEOFI|nr:fungal specific transcription factor, putative [Aspergillus fischeri NRRL 181]EAW20231.1 fungal specific transcription factor, putative [Aspergillus fischeri NRRL 181]